MKLDKSGRSPAFFIKDLISKRNLKTALNYKSKNRDVRICLHKNKNYGNQIMMIIKKKKKEDKFKFYKQNFDKLFIIYKGSILIHCGKKIILEKNKNITFLMKKNVKSYTCSLSKISIYFEIIFKK